MAEMDPHRAVQISVVGKRHSGKSELAFLLFDSYPFDKVAVDPNGDLKMPLDAIRLEPPYPARWPNERIEQVREATGRPERFSTLYAVPDFHSPAYREEMDRLVGMAYGHRRTCLFFDEAHEGAPSNSTPPHMRRALRQGRHQELTTIFATPRPMTVDPLIIANSDWVYVFKLPNPHDRRRVAETIGWDPKSFDADVAELGPFEYLRYDSDHDDLAHMPALPADAIRHHTSRAA